MRNGRLAPSLSFTKRLEQSRIKPQLSMRGRKLFADYFKKCFMCNPLTGSPAYGDLRNYERRRSAPLADEEVAHILRRIINYWRRRYRQNPGDRWFRAHYSWQGWDPVDE